MEATEIKLSWFQKFLKFLVIPTIVANLIKALSMDEGGFSLKKLLTVYAVYVAASGTFKIIASPEFTATTGLWLIITWLSFAGILAGLYSVKDIGGAIATAKGDIKEDAK